MSEWKNKVKRHTLRVEDAYCTGWGITDGLISLVSALKKNRLKKKQKKLI